MRTPQPSSLGEGCPLRVRFTRRVPTIHLANCEPFDGERRLTTLCGATGYATTDRSTERVCAACERKERGVAGSLNDLGREVTQSAD
jgi:hypothetical protein